MSLFKKPKKNIQRRAFSDFSEEPSQLTTRECENASTKQETPSGKEREKMSEKQPPGKTKTSKTLLSFAGNDEEDEEEVFQVKKSSQSKKLMRQLEKERRKKAKGIDVDPESAYRQATSDSNAAALNQMGDKSIAALDSSKLNSVLREDKIPAKNMLHTEIRPDGLDFVLVVKKSDPELVLNGRAALCAGKDDLSSEEEEHNLGGNGENGGSHRFNHPNNFKYILESGGIPDAAMIHAARKSRQKARELGDFTPLEDNDEKKASKKEDLNDDGNSEEEEERIDMNAITGVKEREERREQFYSVQQASDGDSDYELNEWENQQIRKGVTGAQLVSAHQESALSQMMLQPQHTPVLEVPQSSLSTGALLERAYNRNCIEKPKQLQTNKVEKGGPRTPQEVLQKLIGRLQSVKELNRKHFADIDQMETDLKLLRIDTMQAEQRTPVAAGQYRFYQELRGFVGDFVECMDEKLPQIVALEKRVNAAMSKFKSNLIERRRQDVRDQAQEISDQAAKYSGKKVLSDEDRIRRAAEREGRRTRRRRDRERANILESHLDGMSSDDEVPDQDEAQYQAQLQAVDEEAMLIFDDTADEFCDIRLVLMKFNGWKRNDLAAYTDAYATVCLPKVVGPLIRVRLLSWNPFEDSAMDFEKSDWYTDCMLNGCDAKAVLGETEQTLATDADLRFVPSLVEKIIVPKLTEKVETCWDPLSTSQTLKLVGLIGRLGREYPSLRMSSKATKSLFAAILDKMQSALDNDVFIPIFAKQVQEAKTSFFQRQFCSGLKLFRNVLSWQGILSDEKLREIAISSLLNRYLLSAMRVCSTNDAISKSHIIVNTLPRVWLQPDSPLLPNMELFTAFLKQIASQLDPNSIGHMESVEKILTILSTLHATL